MRTEATGPKTGQLSLADRIIARGEAYWEKYKRGEVKLTEEKPAGQEQESNRPLTIGDLNIPDLEPYIG